MNINKDYLNNPVINNKYFFSETDYMDIVKVADCGYVLKNSENELFYAYGQTWQGYVFKDYDSYCSGEGICYLCEFNFMGDDDNLEKYISANEVEEYTRKDFYNMVKEELEDNYDKCFKKRNIPNKLTNTISKIVFEVVDWQAPEAYLYETDWTDEILNYFINNKQELHFASDWLKRKIKQYEKEIIEYANEEKNDNQNFNL